MTALGDETGIARERIHVVTPGDKLSLRGLHIEATGGGEHACIHPDLPASANNGYLINGSLLHPGDVFDNVSAGIEVLLLPIGGPWMKIGEGIDYLRQLSPRIVVPIHQAGLAPVHQDMHCGLLKNLGPTGTEVAALEHAVPLDVPNTAGKRTLRAYGAAMACCHGEFIAVAAPRKSSHTAISIDCDSLTSPKSGAGALGSIANDAMRRGVAWRGRKYSEPGFMSGLRGRKKAQIRRALADAALRLFLGRGYDAASLKEVADAANVSATTLTHASR
ncbi:MBL fold metallo-hydrolase [Nocardia pseudovaccinii]|uniref:MBL fold metallo-hydrolase n=1 Tax=Nocardia pseudovaccinii TaxID=189540 RepID=UPI0009FFF9A2|nr:MBL fold metallo-hydrolase [Nocardia pseudovaccinii]